MPPQSSDRSRAAQAAGHGSMASANVRVIATAPGAEAGRTAASGRAEYAGEAPSAMFDRANASKLRGGRHSSHSAASAQMKSMEDARGGSGAIVSPSRSCRAYGLERF